MTTEEMFERLTPDNKKLVIATIEELIQQQAGEGGEQMTTEERYPNFARLTALLNQQKHPRRMLRTLVAVVRGMEGGTQHDTRKPD